MSETWEQFEGQVVNGEFPLRQLLGSSDYSAVFLTERAPDSPKAAIKLILADFVDAPGQLSRWRMAAKLSHPRLMRVFEAGDCELGGAKTLYVVTEVADEDLSQILPQRSLTPEEARDMLAAVLDALTYVHAQGFVHGSLKPSNIMALADQVIISSDTLRPIGESRSGPAKPGVYDPPETDSGGVSPAGDVWSLGATLVEALTQRLPAWEKDGSAECALPETVPGQFLNLASHCLRRDPRERWTLTQIKAWLQPSSPAHPPPKPVAAVLRETLVKRKYIVPVAVAGLALVAVLVAPGLLDRRPQALPAPEAPVEKQPVPPRSESGRITSERVGKKQGSRATGGSPASPESGTATKTPGGGAVRGEVFQRVLPEAPQKALDTIQGTVKVSVRVAVNPSGLVEEATLESPGPSKYFANLALQATRRWEFWAPRVNGQPVSSVWILRFEFRRTGATAFPTQMNP